MQRTEETVTVTRVAVKEWLQFSDLEIRMGSRDAAEAINKHAGFVHQNTARVLYITCSVLLRVWQAHAARVPTMVTSTSRQTLYLWKETVKIVESKSIVVTSAIVEEEIL